MITSIDPHSKWAYIYRLRAIRKYGAEEAERRLGEWTGTTFENVKYDDAMPWEILGYNEEV